MQPNVTMMVKEVKKIVLQILLNYDLLASFNVLKWGNKGSLIFFFLQKSDIEF